MVIHIRETDGLTAAETKQPSERRRAPRGRLSVARFQDKTSFVSPNVFTGFVRLSEFVLVFCLGLGLYFAYVKVSDVAYLLRYLGATFAGAAATVVIFQVFDLYGIHTFTNLMRQVARIVFAWSTIFALLTAIAFFAKIGDQFSRVWLVEWFLAGGASLIAFRAAITALVRHWSKAGRLNRRAVIVGGGPAGEALIRALEASTETDIRICGVFDDRNRERVSDFIAGYPKLGNISQLLDFARIARIDLLIVSLPLSAEDRVLQLLKKLWVLPVDICLSAHTNKLRFRPRAYSYIGNVPFIDVFDKPIADWDYVIKWAFDKLTASLALVLLSPLLILVAVAIKLDSAGPVLFRQKRHGFNNELIGVYKFRSMYVDQSDANASRLVTKDDPRVTRVGAFIRKTSIDELPQLFNVLKGELSMVGPRPHALQAKAASALYNDVVDGYFARHRVKPGITGWAQINGWRGETDTQEKIQRRVEHDLYYIENWSVPFDVYILLKTPLALLKTDNAY